jgi:hypothetical protein
MVCCKGPGTSYGTDLECRRLVGRAVILRRGEGPSRPDPSRVDDVPWTAAREARKARSAVDHDSFVPNWGIPLF